MMVVLPMPVTWKVDRSKVISILDYEVDNFGDVATII